MKRRLLEILACPVCKHHPLGLEVDQENGEDIIEGGLTCERCGRVYGIRDSIPNMLPPS
jgi:uncharacterized protein